MLNKILVICAAVVPTICLHGQDREDLLSIKFDRESVFNEVVSIVDKHFSMQSSTQINGQLELDRFDQRRMRRKRWTSTPT